MWIVSLILFHSVISHAVKTKIMADGPVNPSERQPIYTGRSDKKTSNLEKHRQPVDAVKTDQGSGKHILMFHPWGTKSHRGQLNALLEGLLNNGHKVTGVFPNKSNIIREGYTEIVVEDR